MFLYLSVVVSDMRVTFPVMLRLLVLLLGALSAEPARSNEGENRLGAACSHLSGVVFSLWKSHPVMRDAAVRYWRRL